MRRRWSDGIEETRRPGHHVGWGEGGALWGRALRFAAIAVLRRVGRPLTIPEILDELDRLGYRPLRSPANKVLADALAHETRLGRLQRTDRGRYRLGRDLHASTLWRAEDRTSTGGRRR